MKTNEISLAIVIASLYTVMVIVLSPISYGPIQLRIADCLIPLSALFGWPAIIGVTVGCLMGNSYFLMGTEDIILGTIANLIAATIIFILRRKTFLACIAGSLPIGIIVGGYLWIFFSPPNIFDIQLPAWGAMIVSITISTIIVVAGIGYIILKTLIKSRITNTLRSRGLIIYIEE
jgi:uncharacterized membrane protein